ncbi:DUF2812 domain-containing protein [Candidatus Enterococcus mansonii]|uniref:DUF2812 domain-containing protein n=1 Tax=Candidatus Enterococcus mansonii TaxID=1834181 RepID=A0A242C680_9ENTE|nr:DUF2812 domain-containing protein [Enterococcus sp. 4G2_DIV0659]OTO05767.1 hypothetical protein A5880_002942 [Enterococcus sp. 4G2_DIV0659]
MKKRRIFVDIREEESYLEEMARKGWGLVKYSSLCVYTFEKITPKTLNYRIDYQTFKKKSDYINYLTLFEDSGWRHISGNKGSGFHFFLPENNQNATQDIFSDLDSGNDRYKRLYMQSVIWGALMIFYFMLFQPSFKNISSWYLTPTLWEYHGLQLFGMIAMETAFVSIQVLPMLFFMACAIYYGAIGIRAKNILKTNKSEN